MIKQWISLDFTLTKRQLGWLLVVLGITVAVVMVAAEVVDSDSGGFGTVQQIGTAVGVLAALVGLTLLPLGDRPA